MKTETHYFIAQNERGENIKTKILPDIIEISNPTFWYWNPIKESSLSYTLLNLLSTTPSGYIVYSHETCCWYKVVKWEIEE